MNENTSTEQQGGNAHTPIVPEGEVRSTIHGLSLFIPIAVKYILRHVVTGGFYRLRRKYYKHAGRTYYLN